MNNLLYILGTEIIILIFGLGLRIAGLYICANKAKELHRNINGWKLFGFLAPIAAMIIIQFLKPLINWKTDIEIKNKHSK